MLWGARPISRATWELSVPFTLAAIAKIDNSRSALPTTPQGPFAILPSVKPADHSSGSGLPTWRAWVFQKLLWLLQPSNGSSCSLANAVTKESGATCGNGVCTATGCTAAAASCAIALAGAGFVDLADFVDLVEVEVVMI
jgi:hypothetical protein